MGYKKAKASEQIHIRMNFKLINEQDNTESTCSVTHIMRAPNIAEREEYQRMLARLKGRKVQSNVLEANWKLWLRCVIRVEGYDDLPSNGDWKLYFQDGVERIHVDEAVVRLIETFESEETEVEKKFVQSSVQ